MHCLASSTQPLAGRTLEGTDIGGNVPWGGDRSRIPVLGALGTLELPWSSPSRWSIAVGEPGAPAELGTTDGSPAPCLEGAQMLLWQRVLRQHWRPALPRPGMAGMKPPVVACFSQALILGPLGQKLMITPFLKKRKKIPLGLCKISSELTVPLSFLLCGAEWLVNALGLSKNPLLPPLQVEPRKEDEPAHPDGQNLLSISLGRQQEKTGQDRQKRCQWEGRGGGNLPWHGRPTAIRAVRWKTEWSL